MTHTELDNDITLTGEIYRSMRVADWPWSWSELSSKFGHDRVELVASIAELILAGRLRQCRTGDICYFELN